MSPWIFFCGDIFYRSMTEFIMYLIMSLRYFMTEMLILNDKNFL